jgi:hypothetical protein
MKMSDTITRLDKVGAFGCPAARNAAGFPEPALSSYELNQNTQNLAAAVATANKQAATARGLSILAFITALSGLAVAGMAWKRK